MATSLVSRSGAKIASRFKMGTLEEVAEIKEASENLNAQLVV